MGRKFKPGSTVMPGYEVAPGMDLEQITEAIPPPIQPRAAQVHVWKNGLILGLIPTHKHPGHSAMELFERGEVARYISWWPTELIGKGNKSKSDDGGAHKSLLEDVRQEMGEHSRDKLFKLSKEGKLEEKARPGQHWLAKSREFVQLPQVSVALPGMGPGNIFWGLHLPSIVAWWDEFVIHEKYTMVSTTNNCSAAVSRALVAGGAECYAPVPISCLVITPREIANWVQQLADRLWALEMTVSRLKRYMMTSMNSLAPFLLPDVPTPKRWIEVSTPPNKIRSQPLQAIDRAFQEYSDLPYNPREFDIEKHTRLVTLIEAIIHHTQGHPTLEERRWVLGLAFGLLCRLDNSNKCVGAI